MKELESIKGWLISANRFTPQLPSHPGGLELPLVTSVGDTSRGTRYKFHAPILTDCPSGDIYMEGEEARFLGMTMPLSVTDASAWDTLSREDFIVARATYRSGILSEPVEPIIDTTPDSDTEVPESSAKSLVTTWNPEGVSYLWKRDGVDLPNPAIGYSGTRSPVLTIVSMGLEFEGEYTCTAYSLGGVYEATSGTVTIGMLPEPVEPIIDTISDSDTEVPESSTKSLVTTWNPEGVSYLWKIDGVDLPDPATGYSGTRSPTLTIESMEVEFEGDYTCTAYSLGGVYETTSGAITIGMLPSEMSIETSVETNAIELPDFSSMSKSDIDAWGNTYGIDADGRSTKAAMIEFIKEGLVAAGYSW